jgi:drug/metabolite transporter (DMT)-like permease
MNRPLLLLIATGIPLGLNFPLAKIATAAGISPALWAAVIALGGGVGTGLINAVLAWRAAMSLPHPHGEVRSSNHEGSSPTVDATPVMRSFEARRVPRLTPQDEVADGKEPPLASWTSLLRYAAISGFLSYVMPSFLTFSAIPRIGSGLAAITFALSPVATALISFVFKVRPPSLFGVAGIALGLLGALVIIVSREASFSVGSGFWLGAALLAPVFLGMGNVYRTLGWPAGASARKLASLTNLAAVPPLLVIALIATGHLDFSPIDAAPKLVATQVVVSTTMFMFLFRLQQVGGPTYLSQMGYVAAAVGVAVGVAWFGETYPVGVWIGTAIIAAGIAVTTVAQVRNSARA